jgi:hypothetical protein
MEIKTLFNSTRVKLLNMMAKILDTKETFTRVQTF